MSEGMSLTGKVAIVTGAARGQGKAEVELLRSLGAQVVATDLAPERDGREGEVLHLRHDVASRADWEEVLRRTLEEFGHADVLVNNAGMWFQGRVLDTTEETAERLYQVNQRGVLLGLQVVGAHLVERQSGSIINVASGGAWRGLKYGAVYSSTKWAVRGLSRSAALDFASDGVRVNTVLPGVIGTEMITSSHPKMLEAFIRTTPLGHMGEASEVAQVVAFLASDASSFVVGAEIAVDGGGAA